MAQIVYFSLKESTLCELSFQTFPQQPPKHHFQPLQMLFNCGTEDYNVIEVQKRGLALLVTENPLHQSLEGAGSIAESEWHAIPFK